MNTCSCESATSSSSFKHLGTLIFAKSGISFNHVNPGLASSSGSLSSYVKPADHMACIIIRSLIVDGDTNPKGSKSVDVRLKKLLFVKHMSSGGGCTTYEN